jgi:50S ribosomal subunit-associated GTPase HflX
MILRFDGDPDDLLERFERERDPGNGSGEKTDQTERETVQTRLTQILSALESSKKSRKWKMRARIGDRVAWHEDPEEVEHR